MFLAFLLTALQCVTASTHCPNGEPSAVCTTIGIDGQYQNEQGDTVDISGSGLNYDVVITDEAGNVWDEGTITGNWYDSSEWGWHWFIISFVVNTPHGPRIKLFLFAGNFHVDTWTQV
mgnify:CR=1 FL=1